MKTRLIKSISFFLKPVIAIRAGINKAITIIENK